ncbi:hypothetical protein [Acetobacter sp.]|uniref:hypothetical protein n=1 Tax=Acetobacter sp. TaxID=440 RepID=UPI0025BB9A9F|nr:hypothetical protein [Acetobacter sp.]MCH4092685.1 hypothetical protein [Acetobacter sp.]MCI1301213.1 hypothetical protein [Acetobacter sp.]MCI1317474.1 hypothetical protein [Acetobacter sp.]
MSNISRNASGALEKNASEAWMETDQYGLFSFDDVLQQADESSVSPTLGGLPSSSGVERESDFPFSSTVISGADDQTVTVSLSISSENADLSTSASDDVLVSGSGSDLLTIRGMASDVLNALRAVTVSASREISSAETVAYSASISNDHTSSLYNGTIVVLPSVLFSLHREAQAVSDSFAMRDEKKIGELQTGSAFPDAVLRTNLSDVTGAVSLQESTHTEDKNKNSFGDSQENYLSSDVSDVISTKTASVQKNDVPVAVFADLSKLSDASGSSASAVLGDGVTTSTTDDQVSVKKVLSAAAVDTGSLSAAVLPQAGSGVAWTSSTISSSDTTNAEDAVATGIIASGTEQNSSPSLTVSSDQAVTPADRTETDVLSAVDTTSTSSQTDNSSVSVTSTLSGVNDIVVNNGVVALDGGTNTVVSQNQGAVSVWSASGNTTFNDAGTGNAVFYVTGTGTFEVQDTGSGSATLKVMQLASSDASGTITGGARRLDVTTGSGDVSIVAGSGGLDLSTAGSGALQIDVTRGVNHILITGDQTGNVTVSGAVVNADANFGITGVVSEKIINGNFVVGLADGNAVTFLGASGSDNITLYLA